jgi:4-alpha-glucanotransferase
MNSTAEPPRQVGVQLPVFSLPGAPGRGTFDGAAAFIEFLRDAGASVWQVLPLGPTHADHSPYLSISAHAGNPEFIGPRLLAAAGLTDNALDQPAALADSFRCLARDTRLRAGFEAFAAANADWLRDHARFMVLRELQGGTHWHAWSPRWRDRHPEALARLDHDHAQRLAMHAWHQFLFFEQWRSIRGACRAAGIRLFGDIPLYVSHDSADVWVNRRFFALDAEGRAGKVAGVPPDYFAETGQRWGNPLYDWQALRDDGYRWWIRRVERQMALYDLLRIDHFRGLQAYWEIPADCPTAVDGCWRDGPGRELLEALHRALPHLDLVAEDLGTITRQVDELREAFGIPGMRVLQFGFDGVPDNPHAPGNLTETNLVYTGTHDNDTCVSWYRGLPDWQRDIVDRELGRYAEPFPLSLVECALASPSRLAMIPLQDLLGLGGQARINTPGTTAGNWNWQLAADWPAAETAAVLRRLKARHRR